MLNEVEGVLCSNRKMIMFGQRWWDEESSGEVSEGQRPVLTEAQERVVMGHSLIPQHWPFFAEQLHHATLSSPGQSQTQHTGTHVHTGTHIKLIRTQHSPTYSKVNYKRGYESSLCVPHLTQTYNVMLLFLPPRYSLYSLWPLGGLFPLLCVCGPHRAGI